MPYSLSIAAVLALLLIALSVNVSRLRLRYRVSFGDAGNPALTAAIRAHGNSLEQSVLFILLLYFIDTATSLNSAWVLGLGAGFVVLRLTYCWAIVQQALAGASGESWPEHADAAAHCCDVAQRGVGA